MRHLAFDLGASGGKLFAGSLQNDRLALEPVYAFPNAIVPFGDGLYWDFFHILTQMNLGVRKAASLGEISSFGIDSFNNDFSLLSPAGELLLPVRCYRDPRTEALREKIYERIPPRQLYAYTGNQLAPFNTLMQLAAMALSGQRPLLQAADQLLFLPDLLGFSITGERQAEYTVAAESQFLDLRTARWIPEILEKFDIPAHILPPVGMPGQQIGTATKAYCARQGVAPFPFVAVCQHDTASAFIAAPVEGAVFISSGTWSLVGLETDGSVITDDTYRHNIANEGGYPGHHRLLKNVMGFWLLQELQKEYAAEGAPFDYEQTQRLAAAAPPLRFLIDPNAPEFFLPGNMREKLRGACLRSTGCAPETPGAFFRCVYEGLALRYRYTVEKLKKAYDKPFSVINMLGGGSRDAFACQCTADACGKTVVAGPGDASAIGNLLVQMIAMGELSSVAQARELVRRSVAAAIYTPANASAWDEHYERFLRICVDEAEP